MSSRSRIAILALIALGVTGAALTYYVMRPPHEDFRMRDGLRYDPIEDDPVAGPIIRRVGENVHAQYEEKYKGVIWRMGMCHGIWQEQKRILKAEHGIDWRTPKEMNTGVVFVSLMFWGWIWGVWGLLFGIPIMMALKAIGDHIPTFRFVSQGTFAHFDSPGWGLVSWWIASNWSSSGRMSSKLSTAGYFILI